MVLNSLNLGTDGALKRGITKAVLVLGVAGMLQFGGTPTPPVTPPGTGGMGTTGSAPFGHGRQLVGRYKESKYRIGNKEELKKIVEDDEELMELIKLFIQCRS